MAKVKTESASMKLSKEMKAGIEKMFEKRFSAIEKQLEKLKGGELKAKSKKGSKKDKPAKSAKAKKKGARKKKTNIAKAE